VADLRRGLTFPALLCCVALSAALFYADLLLAYQIYPTKSPAEEFLQIGQKALADQDWPKAAAAFEQAVRLDPGRAAGHAGLAASRLEMADLAAAESSFQSAVRLQPDNASFRTGLALVYLRQ